MPSPCPRCSSASAPAVIISSTSSSNSKSHGSTGLMHSRLLRPLLVCVGNSVCGFGSLAWASNLGLASLGQVCALALAFNVLIALFLMPVMWRKSDEAPPPGVAPSMNPRTSCDRSSALIRARISVPRHSAIETSRYAARSAAGEPRQPCQRWLPARSRAAVVALTNSPPIRGARANLPQRLACFSAGQPRNQIIPGDRFPAGKAVHRQGLHLCLTGGENRTGFANPAFSKKAHGSEETQCTPEAGSFARCSESGAPRSAAVRARSAATTSP